MLPLFVPHFLGLLSLFRELENPTNNRLVIGMDSTSTTITPPEPQGGPPQTPQAPWKCRYVVLWIG